MNKEHDNPYGLEKKDFESDQAVRWCPGCGDYAILNQVQKVLPLLDIPKEKFVFVSGIGCSSRFPYYMNTYGFHSIHGRAPTIATGIKMADPSLAIWVITGDGDALSIGGNHLIHMLRRNVNITVLLVNNRIYGLTKGQYSPTSDLGEKTKSSPLGSLDNPINPLCIAIASEATFIARTLATDLKHMGEVLTRASKHRGSSFVEIYQNCVIFNDGAFQHLTSQDVQADRMLKIQHGEPLIFGAEKNKGIKLNGLNPEVVNLEECSEQELLVHDEGMKEASLAYLLTQLTYPKFPVPIGVFRHVNNPTYDSMVYDQIKEDLDNKGEGDLEELFNDAYTWKVK